MIEFKITTCSNQNRVGEYLFYKDIVRIGKSIEENDIPLSHEKLDDQVLYIEIKEDKLYAIPCKEHLYFHVNGKKTTGQKLLKRLDRIKVAETTLEIISFTKEIKRSTKDFLNMKVKRLQEENSELLTLLKSLSEYETEL